MTRKFNSNRYIHLWSKKTNDPKNPSGIKLASGNYESFCKKAIDNLCLKVDLCESLEDYVLTLCEGMSELIKLGIPKEKIMGHDLALSKILRFGEDIIEYSENKSDTFYLGVFVDTKISSQWFKLPFYSMVKELILMIVERGEKFPELLKRKIAELLRAENYPLYVLYFLKSRKASFNGGGQ